MVKCFLNDQELCPLRIHVNYMQIMYSYHYQWRFP